MQNIAILFSINGIYDKEKKFFNKNRTPLHYAAENNSKEVFELLISKGADIDAKGIIYLNIILFI